MLQEIIANFIDDCKHYQFSSKAIDAFTKRLDEFQVFLKPHQIKSPDEITYRHLLEFVASGDRSSHIKKVRVWTLHQFFHYLEFHKLIQVNPAKELPYPKMEKSDPAVLSLDELKTILSWFLMQADSVPGLRNLIIAMMAGLLGLRLSTLRNIDIPDVSLPESLLWIREKGYIRRPIPIPQILCVFLFQYLKTIDRNMGPLFLSKQNKRLSARSVQYIFDVAEKDLGSGKHLHCHLFRHTAATQINQTAGVDITQSLLGHRSRRTTEGYIHLDGHKYAGYMARHPYHDLREKKPCMT
jgi:site-specific recombinase XerD